MLNLVNFYQNLTVMLLIIVLGIFACRKKILTDASIESITSFVLKVAFPVAVLGSIVRGLTFGNPLLLWGLIVGAAVLVLRIILAELLYLRRFWGKSTHEYRFALIAGNVVFLGYPLIGAAFGDDGIIFFGGFIVPEMLALIFYGIPVFRKHSKRPKITINVKTIGVLVAGAGIIGIIMLAFPLGQPVITQTLEIIGGLTTPLALICIGHMLSKTKVRELFSSIRIIFVSSVGLVITPILAWLALLIATNIFSLDIPPMVRGAIILMQALPTATILALLANEYKEKDFKSEGSQIVALSTILSAVTVPIIAWVFIYLLG
jgi:predicted permease